MGNIAAYQEGYNDGYTEAKEKYQTKYAKWLSKQLAFPLVDDHHSVIENVFQCSNCNCYQSRKSKFCPDCGSRIEVL